MLQSIIMWATHTIQVWTIVVCIYFLIKCRCKDSYRVFALGWILVLMADLFMVVWANWDNSNNNWVYNIIFPVFQLICCWFLYEQLKLKTLLAAIILFFGFVLYNLFFLQGTDYLNTFSLAAGGVLIFLGAIAQVFRLWKEETSMSLFSDPCFWVCTGFVIYWGINTPFYTLYNYLYRNYENFFITYFNYVSFGITMVLNVCIIKALQCRLSLQKK